MLSWPGFTGQMGPLNPPLVRLSSTLEPTEPGRGVAPMRATERA
jgi:hypothetical protein